MVFFCDDKVSPNFLVVNWVGVIVEIGVGLWQFLRYK